MDHIKELKCMILLLTFMLLGLIIFDAWHYGKMEAQLIKINDNITSMGKIGKNQLQKSFSRSKYATFILKVTAYSSEREQTDNDPFVAAWNNLVGNGMVAVSRDLERIGITNRVPVLINGKEYVIGDRMHKRKKRQLDIWMMTRESAEKWGIQYHHVLIPIEHIDFEQLFEKYEIRIK